MSKFQTDRELFYGICKFFSSNAWWRPIIQFIYSNSRSFLNSFEYSTEDEHNVYIKFMDMITDLVDNYMCSKLHISSDAFENFMVQFLTKPNDKATVIFETLKQATNYNEFCKQMHLCNIRIENSITRALLKFSEDESITSTDELAVFVAKQIEQDQNVEIDDLVHKACVQTKKMMGINVLNSTQKKSDSESKKIISTPKKLDSSSKTDSSLNASTDEIDEDKNQDALEESNKKADKEKRKKHKHSHHSHHSHSKLNKSRDQNKNTDNINDNTIIIKDENDKKILLNNKNSKRIVLDGNEMNNNDDKIQIDAIVNKNIKDENIKNDLIDDLKNNREDENVDDSNKREERDNDENSDLSEVSEDYESEEDSLISTLAKRQLQNKSSLNRSFLRPPVFQRSKLLGGNSKITSKEQKKPSASIVFDSP